MKIRSVLQLCVYTGLLLFLLPLHARPQDPVVCSGHPDYKPYMWRYGNSIVGAGAELTRLIFNELDKPFAISYQGPWARVQEMVQRNRVDVIVGAYNNAARREYMIYLHAYAQDKSSVFVKKGSRFALTGKSDLIGKKGVTMHGDSFGDELDKYITAKLNVFRVYDSVSLFKKLISGTTDYILWGDFPCQINAAMAGFNGQITKLSPPLAVENMHITVSKKSAYAKLVPDMNRIIDRLVARGRVTEILDKYVRLYVDSQKIDRKKEENRVVMIWIDPSLRHQSPRLTQVTRRVWPHAVVKSMDSRTAYNLLLTDQKTLIFTLRHKVEGIRNMAWRQISNQTGFASHSNFDQNGLALWQLSYEALLNNAQ
jgi:polar amino acid transport system substrate-binding protein